MTKKTKKKSGALGLVLILLILLVGAAAVLTFIGKDNPLAGTAAESSAPPRGGMRGGGLMGRGGGSGGEPSGEETAYTVLTRTVEPETLESYLKFNGDVIAETSVDIYPDTAGELTELFVSLGSFVRKGQILAKVDPSLPGQVFVANPVRSTITGTITDLPFKVGATISSAQVPIATVGDLGDLQIDSFISEKYMARIALGQRASVRFEPFGEEDFSAVVSEISPVLDRSSRTLEIKLTLDGRDPRIKSGMFGSVKLTVETKQEVLAVPNESLIASDEGTFVYLAGEDMRAEKRFVETGLVVDGRTEITRGLAAGDALIVRGQSMLKEGSALRAAE